jgi:hypothetical protein
MNDSLSAVIREVSLDLNSGLEGKANVVIKSTWISSSDHSLVAVACPNLLRIFSFGQVDASLELSIPFSGVPLVDFVSAPSGKTEGMLREKKYKLFVLLEDGQLREIFVQHDNNEWLMEESSVKHCLQKEKTGVRHDNSEFCSKLGSLVLLEQGNLLVYDAGTTAVSAFILDEKCDIKGSFDFLPAKIPSTILGPSCCNDVVGPYSHWREVGIVRRDSCTFFRVCCTGHSSDGDEPVLLYMEFNESEVRIQKLGSNSAGWFDGPASYEGLAVFSAPLIMEDSNASFVISEKLCVEVTFLCTLTLNGTMRIFSEATSCRSRPILERSALRNPNFFHASGQATLPDTFRDHQFQLLDFEKLQNITESPEVEFGGNSLSRYVTIGMS